MSSIRNKETKPEILVRKFLHSKGLRYRLHDDRYPGKPDIVLPKYHTMVFVNGCFWHGHNCKAAKLPKTNISFWKDKISKNKIRDKENYTNLDRNGWNVIVVWQCEINNREKLKQRLSKLIDEITIE